MAASTPESCPSCGVVVPAGDRHCPACRSCGGRGRFPLPLVGVAAVMAAAAFAAWTARPRPDPALWANVRVTSGGFLPARDGRGTDVSGFIENLNPVTVDVTVRVRGYDVARRVVAEATLGPYMCAPNGRPYPILVALDCAPLDSVTLDATDVRRVDNPPRIRAAGRFVR